MKAGWLANYLSRRVMVARMSVCPFVWPTDRRPEGCV